MDDYFLSLDKKLRALQWTMEEEEARNFIVIHFFRKLVNLDDEEKTKEDFAKLKMSRNKVMNVP